MVNDAHTPPRAAERIAIRGDVRGEIMVFQPLLIREISVKGAAIETSFPLHIDSLHDVRLALGDVSVVVKGRVANSHVSEVERGNITYRSGLEFVAVSDAARGVIAAFLDALKAGETPI